MVVDGPTSPRPLGSLGTSVHTYGFKCFVRTFRPLLIFGAWKTEIVECHSATGISFRNFAQFLHRHDVGLQRVHVVHDFFCKKIDESGRDGLDLADAFSNAYHSFQEQHAVDGLR